VALLDPQRGAGVPQGVQTDGKRREHRRSSSSRSFPRTDQRPKITEHNSSQQESRGKGHSRRRGRTVGLKGILADNDRPELDLSERGQPAFSVFHGCLNVGEFRYRQIITGMGFQVLDF
jgi:hypothetical protein